MVLGTTEQGNSRQGYSAKRLEKSKALEARLRGWTLKEDNRESPTAVQQKVLP